MGRLDFSRNAEIIEITIRDGTKAKIESFVANNKKQFNTFMRIIQSKYPQFGDENETPEQEKERIKKTIDWFGIG